MFVFNLKFESSLSSLALVFLSLSIRFVSLCPRNNNTKEKYISQKINLMIIFYQNLQRSPHKFDLPMICIAAGPLLEL